MRRFVLAAASVAALACLGACSDGDGVADATAAEPTASADPTPLDPYAWTEVPYQEYLDAADQIGLRPDVLVPEAGFSSGLNELCHTSPADFVTMRKSQMANTKETETYTAAKYLGDEVGLRIGLACPQRMGDWAATDDDHVDDDGNSADDDVSEVTDADLARAEAEEAAASHEPDYGHGDYSSPSPSAESTDTSSDDGQVSTTSTGGVTTGNGTTTR